MPVRFGPLAFSAAASGQVSPQLIDGSGAVSAPGLALRFSPQLIDAAGEVSAPAVLGLLRGISLLSSAGLTGTPSVEGPYLTKAVLADRLAAAGSVLAPGLALRLVLPRLGASAQVLSPGVWAVVSVELVDGSGRPVAPGVEPQAVAVSVGLIGPAGAAVAPRIDMLVVLGRLDVSGQPFTATIERAEPPPGFLWSLDLASLDGATVVAANVPFLRATIRWSLDDAGSAEVDLRDDQVGADRWLPMRRRLIVRREGTPVWAGIVLGLSRRLEDGVPRWTARALGLRAWLERRVVHGDQILGPAPATEIAWQLIEGAQAQADGRMGMSRGAIVGSAPIRTRTYCDASRSVADAIAELADRDVGGFDWEVDAFGRFNAWVGGRGADLALELWIQDHLAENGWHVEGDWGDVDTYASALPEASECAPLPVVRTSSLLSPATYGRWESVVSGEGVDDAELAELADEHLRASARGRVRLRLARSGPWGSPWPGFGLGDRPLVHGLAQWGVPDPVRMRVIAYTATLEPPGLEWLEAELELA